MNRHRDKIQFREAIPMSSDQKQPLSNTFSPRLEAIRGIAALMVALCHSMAALVLITPTDQWLKQASVVLGNGGAAVTIFFVLSGHVLGLSIKTIHSHPIRYWFVFLIRRALRIYPAMLVCLLCCAAYLAWIYLPDKYPAASREYYQHWQQGANWDLLYRNIILIDNYINPVTWTLQVELLGALAFPFLYTIKTRYPTLSYFLFAAWLLYFIATPLYSYFRTGFIYMFLVGLYVNDVSRWFHHRLQQNLIGKISALGYFGLCFTNLIIPESTAWGWILESAFALLLLASLITFPNQSKIPWLDSREARFIGKISYSFYLWHFPVLYISATEMFKVFDTEMLLNHPLLFQWALFGVSSALTIPVASLSYRWIELPCKTRLVRCIDL